MAKCDSKSCEGEAVFRFTWPGQAEQCACTLCAVRAVNVARFMGFFLEAKPLHAASGLFPLDSMINAEVNAEARRLLSQAAGLVARVKTTTPLEKELLELVRLLIEVHQTLQERK